MKIETEIAISRGVCDSEYGKKLLRFVESAILMQPFEKPNFTGLDELTKIAVMDKKNNGSDMVVMAVPADYGKWSLLSLPMSEYAEELSLFVKRNN
jgi:3-dehydroquinate synthetase